MTLEQLEERQLLSLGVGANVNISQRPGNQAETTIAIDRTNTDNLFAASNTELANGIFTSVSTDAGVTWGGQILGDGTDGLPLACCDPSAVYDDFGNLFLTYLENTLDRIVVLSSVDGGVSFTLRTQLGFFADQPTITAGANSVWVTWEQGGSIRAAGAPVTGLGTIGLFGVQQTVPGSNGGSFGDIAIGPAGQVMVTYQRPSFGEGPAQIFTNVDPDGLGPLSFGFANLATDTNVGGFDFIPPQFGRSVDAEAGLAYDRTGGLNDGRAYLVYTDESPDESDDTDIFVRFSDDNGASWSVPVRVNDDTTTNSQFLPRMALDQTSGAVAVVWHDSRNDDGLLGSGDTNGIPNDDAQFFGTVSSDGGSTFETNVLISAGTSNAEAAQSLVDYGDYTGLDFFQGLIYPSWADNSDSLGDNPTAPEFDVFTAQVVYTDTTGPFIVSVVPADGSLINGPINFMDFTFNEVMNQTSFDFGDVTQFEVTNTLGATINLIPQLTTFQWIAPNVLRVRFATQGPAGDYTITIGPGITDIAGNAMNQDMDTTNGESPDDQFTSGFTIPTLVVTSVQLNPGSILLNLNKPGRGTTVTSDIDGDCNSGAIADNIFLERAGGDNAFVGDVGNSLPDVCVATLSTLTTPTQITITLIDALPAGDQFRLHVISGGVTDVFPMNNPLDGEFDGAPPAGNDNTFPSGDGVVGGDFLYRFYNGTAPLRGATAEVLPDSFVTGDPIAIGAIPNASAPSIAIDPLDPLRMVAAWTVNDTIPQTDLITVEAAFSVNGGQTWSSFFFPFNLPNPAVQNAPAYPEATDISVAFDRTGSFYLVFSEHTGDYANGAIVLEKFNLSGGAPVQTIFDQILYQWTSEAAFNPTIAIDTSVPTFTDPETGLSQDNPWSGNVYVAWNTQTGGQTNVTNHNPNVIKVIASSDGGSSFSTPVSVSDGTFCTFNGNAPQVFGVDPLNCGTVRHGLPRMTVSQGTADGRVAPGQITFVWDEFSGSFNQNPPRSNIIRSDRVTDGAVGAFFQGNGGFVADGFDPGNSQPHIPSTSTFSITVDINDPRFATLSDLDVVVNLQHSALNEVRLRLIPPAASGLGPIVLANNRTDAANNTNNNVGMTGADIGNTTSGFFIGGFFDQDAPRSIVSGAAPYTGRFRPEGSLDVLSGLTAAQVNGAWTLEVTDFRASNITQPPFPNLVDWGLNLTGGLTLGADNLVAQVCALATANGPHVSRPTASPARGISSGVSVASDNTLGSFSAFQGRLYMTLAHASTAGNCSGAENDFNIFMLTSDNGGVTWTVQGQVNDDHILDSSTGDSIQFNPAVTVDPATGTVITAWLDGRDDAANARVATYVATSNDGGQSWSKNVFLNRQHTATDCALQFVDPACGTTQPDLVYGPIPDNQSSGNSSKNQRFEFGDSIGVVALNGIARVVWPGNENVTDTVNPTDCCATDIFVGQFDFAAGPRVADSTMGWVDSPVSSFTVSFDRFVDPRSFSADPGIPGSVLFTADFEIANDTITGDGFYGFTFDNTGSDGIPGTIDDGLWHRSTGRGSDLGHSSSSSMYFGQGEGPAGGGNYDTGSQTSGRLISPLIDLSTVSLNSIVELTFNYFLETEAFAGFDRADVNVVVSSATTVASNTINLLDPSFGFQSVTIDISQFIGQQIQLEFSFDSVDAALNFFEGWYVDDVVVSDLGVPPDVQLFHRDVFGNDTPIAVTGVFPISCSVVGCNQFQVEFAPQTETGTYYYSVGPSIQDKIRLASATIVPGSTISQAAVPPQVPRPIVDAPANFVQGITRSTISINSAPPNTVIADVNVTLTLEHTCDNFDLILWLEHPDGTRALLSVQEPIPPFTCTVNSYTNTTFDDQAGISITVPLPPLTGSFQPEGPLFGLNGLSAFNGKAVNGDYVLEVWDIFPTDTGRIVSWSLDVQTGVVISTVRPGNFMDQNANGVTREPAPVTAPPLFTSSTRSTHDMYLTPLEYGDTGTLPLMVTGPRVDPTPGSIRIGTEYTATDPALPLPLVNGGVVESSFFILDHNPITDLDVVVDISGANLADLRVELVHEDNLQTIPLDPTTILLFDAGDASGTTLSRTVFSDEAAAMIAPGGSPYRTTFRPRGTANISTLGTLTDSPATPFSQTETSGIWTLRITDTSGAAGVPAGTLNSWGLIVNPTRRYTSSLIEVPLGDFVTTIPTITVPESFLVSELEVTLDISHPINQDLDIALRHLGSNTVVNLVADVTAAGSNFSSTTFDDQAPNRINAATNFAPYTGHFVPMQLLSAPAVPDFSLTPALALADGATTVSSILVTDPNPITIRDLSIQLGITHAQAADLDIVLRHVPSGRTATLVTDVQQGGANFTATTFDDEAPLSINSLSTAAPYRGFFMPETALSTFDGIDARGQWALEVTDDTANAVAGTLTDWTLHFGGFAGIDALGTWRLEITDDTGNTVTGVLNNWTLDFGSSVQQSDQLALHGTANFIDVVFDRDMDPASFTTDDIKRIIGPAGQIGADPLGPFRYSTLDTTPLPVPIPDSGQVQSVVTVTDSYNINDVDVLVEIVHPSVDQLHLVLIGPNGARVELIENLPMGPTPDLINTILDDEGLLPVLAALPPYAGHFRPTQSLSVFDNMSVQGDWTLEVNDEGAGGTGSLVRWNLIVTADPHRYFSTLANPLAIPDTAVAVTDTITVPDSFPINDLEVTLNITHPQVQDLEVTLIGPDGTTVPLVANLPATGQHLANTVLDDEAPSNITTSAAPYTGTFRPVLPPAGRITQLSDYKGLNAQGVWTLQVRDRTAGNSTGAQRLNAWSLAMTESEFRVLPNPNGTDPDASSPRTYRVYFPLQRLSGSYLVSIGSEITSAIGEELDENRNAGLAALRRGDGSPNSPETAVDFQSVFTSADVGTPVSGLPIVEPFGTARRVVTSRIFVPDNVTVADINVELTLTNQQPPGTRALMRDDDYDVFLVSPSGTRFELFSDIGGAGVDFVNLMVDDEAARCLKSCQPVYVQDGNAPFSNDFRPEALKAIPNDCDPNNPAATFSRGLCVFDGEEARGVWTLEIIDDTPNGLTASLRTWSVDIAGRTTGLGEYRSDQVSTSFRLFVMDPSDPRSSSSWTAVGPAGVGGVNTDSSRSGAIAVDPSDPSGNTVYVAGATSGVWKTNNFLTTDPSGPTWIPLTDFAQTFGLHIGSIALFPRNNDPNQTVVYVATGEGDGGFTGVGFFKSEDGGATWQLQDSLNNDPNIPFALRDHTLSRSTTAFKIIVDPTFPDGRVAYAALSGFAGGLYKTVNGGLNWVNTRAGQATDVVLDLVNTEVLYSAFRGEGVFISSNRGAQWLLMGGGVNNVQMRDVDPPGDAVTIPITAPSGTPNGGKGRISLAKPFLTGDVDVDRAFEGRLYAAVATPDDLLDGVYMTSDFGANWTRLELGREDTTPAGLCPAIPLPTNNDTSNVDVDPFAGAGCSAGQGNYDQAIIADPLNPNRFYVFGTGYASSPVLAIDVSLTYDGHNYTIFDHDNGDGGLTEFDTVGGANRKLNRDTGVTPPSCEPFAAFNATFFCNDFGGNALGDNLSRVGLYRGKFNNIASFANNGFETRWSPFLIPAHVDYHDVAAYVDPLTGKSRLIVGTDGGVYSVLTESGFDVNGDPVFSDNVVNALPNPGIGNAIGPANGSRNGNLQMTQAYGGATQPNQISAEIAALFKNGGMFYVATQDNSSSKSDPQILDNGDLGWSGYGASGDSGGGLTAVLSDDDSPLPNGLPIQGTVYIFEWSCCMAPGDEAFVIRRDNIPAVTGLDRENLDGAAGFGPRDFSINYRDGRELLFSPPSGRLYKTDDAGLQWLEIGDPVVFGSQMATALAFGAEQPITDPLNLLEPDEILYVGLPSGRILTSLNEGGDNGQEWFDISAGVFGGAVEDVAPNIRQFSHETYLVTSTRVFFMPEDPQPDNRVCRYPGRNDIIPGGSDPIKSRFVRAVCDVIQNGPASNANNSWIDITGNINSARHTVFPGAWNGEGPLGPIVDSLPFTFSSIKVDDRYQIPDAQGQRHPLVYVAGGGVGSGAGVYRTFDNGQSWRRYPDPEIDGAPIEGGFLPNVGITEIELAIGPYDPETGLSDFTTSLDLLVATTYGRGMFAIRSAPLIFTAQGGLVQNAPDLFAPDDTTPPVPPFPPAPPGSGYSQDNITRNDGFPGDANNPPRPLRFQGLTHRGAEVRLLEDENGVLTEIGRGLSDFFTGDWTVFVGDTNGDGTPDGGTLECGQHVIRAQGISASGTVGQVSDSITVTVLSEPPTEFAAPDLLAIDDSGASNTDNLTRIPNPRFSGATFCGGTGEPVPQAIIRLMVRDPSAPLGNPNTIIDPNDPNPATNRYRTVGLGSSLVDGTWVVQVDPQNFGPALADATYTFVVRAEDLAGNIGPLSPSILVTIDTTTPTPVVTGVRDDTCAPQASLPPTPCTFGSRSDGITADGSLFFDGTAEVASIVTLRRVGGPVLSNTIVTGSGGTWTFDNTAQTLAAGTYSFTASSLDLAGNVSAVSVAFTVVVDTSIGLPSTPDLVDASDSGLSNTDNITNDNTPTFTGTAEPNSRVQLSSNVLGSLGFANVTAAGNWTFTSATIFSEGQHSITAVATDLAGNVSLPSGTLNVTIDTIPPANPPTTPDLCSIIITGICPEVSDTFGAGPPPSGTNTDDYTNDISPTFTGTAEANGTVTIFDGVTVLGQAPVGPDIGGGFGNWTFTGQNNLAAGQHSITARATDVAGNNSQASAALIFTIDTTVATPGIPDLAAASDSGNSNSDNLTNATALTFTGTAESAPGNGTVEVFAGVISLGATTVNTLGNWTLTANVTPATLPDGSYSVSARQTDRAGNVSANSSPMSPNLVIDRTAPNPPTMPDLTAASDTGSSNTDNTTRDDTPTFTGNAAAGSIVRVFDGAVLLGQTNPGGNGVWTFTSPSLIDGLHAITATATDAAGNTSNASPVLNVRIDTMIAQPLAPDLDPSSDTGVSSTDNNTRDNTPTFTNAGGSAEAGSTVTIFDGASPIGTVTASATGSWTFTAATTFVDGVHGMGVRTVDVAGNIATLPTLNALNVTIDTVVAAPVITSISDDRGPRNDDRITNDGTLIFQGTAEVRSSVQFSQTAVGVISPCPIPSPDVTANATTGIWIFDNTCRTLGQGNFSFTAVATDVAGNVSTPSSLFPVVVDTTPPIIAIVPPNFTNAPTLALGDDTGVQNDLITNLRSPRLTGSTEANVQVQIFDANNTVVGTATAAGNGTYVVQFSTPLADGSHTVEIHATDSAGNFSISSPLTFRVDGTAPQVNQFLPDGSMGNLAATTSTLVVTFNDDNLNDTALGNPAFAGSVQNRSNFRLTGNSFGTVDLANSLFVYDSVSDILTISLRNASGSPFPLPNDTWVFRIDGSTSLQDIAGNKIDGETPGTRAPDCVLETRPTGLPSGNCVAGGDFVQTFTIAVPPPIITRVQALFTRKVVTGLIVDFSSSLDRTLATNGNFYELRDRGKDGRLFTNDDSIIGLQVPTCNPLPAACTTVTLTALRGFSKKRRILFTAQDDLVDVGGNRLDGDRDNLPGGDFIKDIGPIVTPGAGSQVVASQVVSRVDNLLASGDTPMSLLLESLLEERPRYGRIRN